VQKLFYSLTIKPILGFKARNLMFAWVSLLICAINNVTAADDIEAFDSAMHLAGSAEQLKFESVTNPGYSNSDTPITLEPITIFATPESLSLTVPNAEESQFKLDQVPGGTTLIEGKRIKEGAAFTVNDAFAYAPGVYVEDSQAGMTGGSRISIRGSDINSAIIPIRGLKFLRNGMPFTHANGFTDTENLNMYAIQHIEIYRGANALEYGASNLGGAINIVTPTGYTAERLKVGMALATNGYVNPSVSAGGKLGNGWDAYGSFSYIDFNGNINHTEQELFYGYGNIGYRWGENHETRLHLDLQDFDFNLSVGLTKQQIEEDPRQNLLNPKDRPSGFPTQRVDLQHTIRLADGDQFDIGAYFFNKEFNYNFQDFVFINDLWQDAGFSWRHQLNGEVFGLNNQLVWGGLAQWLWINYKERQPQEGQPGFIRFNERYDWNNVEAYIEDKLSLSDNFTLVLGGQINYRRAEYNRIFPAVQSGLSSPADQDFFNVNPKLGFTWQATPSTQIYGNISRSSEPPPLKNLSTLFQTAKLTSQTGTTLEMGTRGGNKQFKWDLALYHAWLNLELLTIPTAPFFIKFDTINAKNTEHTGIELGLESTLPLNLIAAEDQLRLRGSYTWSRFVFDNDPKLGNNRLPGIPEHNGRIEALYQHPSGFYIGPNVTLASSNWVDFANTLAAQPYALLGTRVGWDDGMHWKVFLDGRNLTNEHYAAAVFVTGDASSSEGLDRRGTVLFNPGATRMVFAGFEYRY
jgi:iron complex outermembrane recepter protein